MQLDAKKIRVASSAVDSGAECAVRPAEEERAFLCGSAAYAEHLGAALPRLLPAAKGDAQRTSIVKPAPETTEASLLQPDEQAQEQHTGVRVTSKTVLAAELCNSGAGGLDRRSVSNKSSEELTAEPRHAADARACIGLASAASAPLASLPEAGSNAQGMPRRTLRKASSHCSIVIFDRQRR